MIAANARVPPPVNEPVKAYAPGSPERQALIAELGAQQARVLDIPAVVDGERVSSGNTTAVRAPHAHAQQLGQVHNADPATIQAAIDAAEIGRAHV